MKILPDYLIQYMPELEEALEELRLSVIDHAYELLKCLDIDELSSDDIRRKLELYSIKLENMTSDWLPNGRFYRMYPSIKHHRTRHNTITSIVKSGGQFEGVWSSDFTEKQQYNYKLIQLLRHYQMQSPMDGYFYISGDATRNTNGSISGSTLTALSSDALLTQALPAGYTYIYVPWPRPHYPADSDYFYNVHMLQFDRFHYAEDCDKPYGYNGNVYDLHKPASLSYYNAATAKQPPYWFDYHYIGDDKHPNLITVNGNSTYKWQWPIVESGIYKDKDNNEIAKIVVRKDKETGKSTSQMFRPYDDGDIRTWIPIPNTDVAEIELLNKKAVEYVLDKSCAGIADSRASWITNCYLHTKYRFSEPNRSQIFTPIERSIVITPVNDVFNNTKDVLCQVFGYSNEEASRVVENLPISVKLKIEDCTDDYLRTLCDNVAQHATIAIFTNDSITDRYDREEIRFAVICWLGSSDDVFNDQVYNAIRAGQNLVPFLVDVNKSSKLKEFFDFLDRTPKSPIRIARYNSDNKSDIASEIEHLCNINHESAISILDGDGILQGLVENKHSAYEAICKLQKYGCIFDCDYYSSKYFNIECNFIFEIAKNSIDENCLIEPDLRFSPKSGAYKFDRLTAGLLYHFTESLHHVKTYRPVWDVSSPICAMSQSDYISSNDNDSEDPASWGHSSHSLLSWFTAKQDNNIPALSKDAYYYGESFIRDNGYMFGVDHGNSTAPTASQETFTSFDRPTTSALDPIYLALFYPAHVVHSGSYVTEPLPVIVESEITITAANDDHEQGDIYHLSDHLADNKLYAYNEASPVMYDPRFAYTVMNFNADGELVEDDFSQYIKGHPSAQILNNEKSSLLVCKNSSSDVGYNYVTYKTSLVHKLWFKQDKTGKDLEKESGRDVSQLYNSVGETDHYFFTSINDNFVTLSYNVLGVYKEDGTKIEDAPVSLACLIDNDRYVLYYSSSEKVKDAAYVLFTVSVINKPMEAITTTYLSTELWLNTVAVSRQIISNKENECLNVTFGEHIIPSINGGSYVTELLAITLPPIEGGNYVTDSLNITIPPIDGGGYVTESVDVVYPILGGSYVTDTLSITNDIAGGEYNSEPFDVENYISGASYGSAPFDVESYISGANYGSAPFNVESYIGGANYSSSSFDVEGYISGASYWSAQFNVEDYVFGANYGSSPFDTESYISGANYESSSFNTESYVAGVNYDSSSFNTESYVGGAGYSSNEFDTEQYIDGSNYNSDSFETE